jgi:hypothetical protein
VTEVPIPVTDEPEVDATFDADTSLLEQIEKFEAATAPVHGGDWKTRVRILPPRVTDFLRSSVRVPFVREAVLQAAESELLGDLAGEARDMAELEARWREKVRPAEAPATLRWLRGLRDEIVRSFHFGRLYQHARPRALPPNLRAWRPTKGALVIDDLPADPRGSSIGYAPYMEHTPPLLVRYVHGRWLERVLAAGRQPSTPGGWDLTAGSGTGHDLLRALGVRVVSTDLTPCSEPVATCDVRKVATFVGHRGFPRNRLRGFGLGYEGAVVRRPDLVLIDPPSRGTPTPSEVYGSEWPAADLGLLPREAWVGLVTAIATFAVVTLANCGVVSLLVRAGVRDGQRVTPDENLVRDLKSQLGEEVAVLEEVRLLFRRRVRQASLGSTRVPAVHLLLGRAS